jgi:hypothetical protein
MPGHTRVMMSKLVVAKSYVYKGEDICHGQLSGRLCLTESGSPPGLFLLLDAESPTFWIFASLEGGMIGSDE